MDGMITNALAGVLVFCGIAYASLCLAFTWAYPRPAARHDARQSAGREARPQAGARSYGVTLSGRVVIVPFASDWAPAATGDVDYAYAARRPALTIGAHVAIQGYSFRPALIHVPAGTTVRWTNQDTVPHTVTFTSGAADSGVLAHGKTFDYTFTTPGVFDYFCRIHPNMMGIVHVTM